MQLKQEQKPAQEQQPQQEQERDPSKVTVEIKISSADENNFLVFKGRSPPSPFNIRGKRLEYLSRNRDYNRPSNHSGLQ